MLVPRGSPLAGAVLFSPGGLTFARNIILFSIRHWRFSLLRYS